MNSNRPSSDLFSPSIDEVREEYFENMPMGIELEEDDDEPIAPSAI